MKKILFSLALVLLVLPFLTLGVKAEETVTAEDVGEAVERFAETDRLYDGVPEEMKEDVQSLLDSPSPTTVFQFLLDAILPQIRACLPFFYRLMAMVLISALFRSARCAFGQKKDDAIWDFVTVLVFSLFTYASLEEGIRLCQQSLTTLTSLMVAGLPVLTMLSAMAGQSGSAALQSQALSFFVSGAGAVYSSLLFPALKGLFALFTAGAVGDGGAMPLFRLGKKTLKRCTVFGFTIVGAMLALKNALALSADTLAMRSVRFAAGNFIPVVGSMVGENTRALTAALSAVKARCGVVLIVIVLLLVLPPILSLFCKKLLLSLAGALAAMLGEEKLTSLMEGLGELFDLVGALLISQGVFFIFYLALFLKGGTS